MIDVLAWLQGITLKRLLIYGAVLAVSVFLVAFLTSHYIDKIEGEWRHKSLVGLAWILGFIILVAVLLFLEVTNYAAFTTTTP